MLTPDCYTICLYYVNCGLHNMNCVNNRTYIVMCTCPVPMPNKNYGLHIPYKNTTSAMILRPCGHCEQCIANKQMKIIQRVLMESFENHFFYSTLTYSNDALPFYPTSSGYTIRFADVVDVQNMIKRIRTGNMFGRSFKFFAVSELGSKRARPHFHILWMIPKLETDTRITLLNLEKLMFDVILSQWKRNIALTTSWKGNVIPDRFRPEWQKLCIYKRYYTPNGPKFNYDTHYVRPSTSVNGVTDVAFYVLKYMLKPCDRAVRLQRALRLNLSELEYNEVWSTVRPRYLCSKHFGLTNHFDFDPFGDKIEEKRPNQVYDYIRKCIVSSYGKDYPEFVNPVDGSHYPMAAYYLKRYLTYEDAKHFRVYNEVLDDKNIIVTGADMATASGKASRFARKRQIVESREIFDDCIFD